MYNPANRLLLELVLLAYDSILTFHSEMEYVWKKKLKLGAALYLLTRYVTICITVLDVLLQLSNISVQVRFVSIPNHSDDIV